MNREKKIIVILSVVTIISIVILLITLFKGSRPVTDHSEVIAAKDETIKAIAGERDAWRTAKEEQKIVFQQQFARDSVLALHYLNNQKIYTQIDEKINSIPAYINRISGNDDSIRAAFSGF
jgi:hypothetical protein